jgi:hypothetical protein
MKNPYKFSLRSRAGMMDYLGEHESYWPMNSWNRGFVISWNVKVHHADFTGRSGGEPVNPVYDDRWRDYADRNDDRLFWRACEEAALHLMEGDYSTYPGSDQGSYRFALNGRQGGHLWLSHCEIVPQPRAWAMAPFIFQGQEHWKDYLSGLPFPDLRRLYKAIACMDQDFTRKKITAEVSHHLNYYRYEWELEQEEVQAAAARKLEAARPDMYGRAAV